MVVNFNKTKAGMRMKLRMPALAAIKKFIFGYKPQPALMLVCLVVALLMSLPLFYVILRAAGSSFDIWARLLNERIPFLLSSTIGLTFAVTALTILIGVPLAWLTAATDLPFRRTFSLLIALPLAVPPYIGAFIYISILGPRGFIQQLISKLLGIPPNTLEFPSIYGFWGTMLVLTFFTYPYVFLLASAAIKVQNQNLIDAARSLGLKPIQIFRRVTVPLLRPSIGAGGILVALYVLSDFGAVAMMRYPTFTSAIYQQLIGRYDRSAAAVLSSVLILLTIIVISWEWFSRAKSKYHQTVGTYKKLSPVSLGRWRYPALLPVALIIIFTLVLPISMLTYWAAQNVLAGALDTKTFSYIFNSLMASGFAATLALLFALPVAYLTARNTGLYANIVSRLSYASYALPGIVVALGVAFLFNQLLPWFYGTVVLVVFAYVLRFMPQALQAQDSAITAISPNIEDAAKSCGCSTVSILRRIIIPLILPGLTAGWTLVFLSSMKELPVTLILRPAGFDTLAVRVWIEASEGFYTLAAPSALVLIFVSILPLAWLLSGGAKGIKE